MRVSLPHAHSAFNYDQAVRDLGEFDIVVLGGTHWRFNTGGWKPPTQMRRPASS